MEQLRSAKDSGAIHAQGSFSRTTFTMHTFSSFSESPKSEIFRIPYLLNRAFRAARSRCTTCILAMWVIPFASCKQYNIFSSNVVSAPWNKTIRYIGTELHTHAFWDGCLIQQPWARQAASAAVCQLIFQSTETLFFFESVSNWPLWCTDVPAWPWTWPPSSELPCLSSVGLLSKSTSLWPPAACSMRRR